MKKKTTNTKSLFDAKVGLVHTTDERIVRALESPTLKKCGDELFVEGRIIAPKSDHFDHGKRIVISIRHIVAFTAFDSADEFYKHDPNNKLKLVGFKTNGA